MDNSVFPRGNSTMTKNTQVPFKQDWHRNLPPEGEGPWGDLWNESADYYRQNFTAGTFELATPYIVRRWAKVDTDPEGQPIYGFIEYTLLGSQIVTLDPDGRQTDLSPKAKLEEIKYLRAFYTVAP